MHMMDALLSTPVALTGVAGAVGLLAIAGKEIKEKDDTSIIPLMGVLGAFVFAAQMINFAIPGTGSSGHVIGGVLLAAFLGPWAAFLTIASVLIIQCLVFADGGLLALGCNLINMGAMTTLVAYPLIYRPIVGDSKKTFRIAIGAILACLIGLELGSTLVTIETMLSGVSALKFGQFFSAMALIHIPIGIVEGLATAGVLAFVADKRPDLLNEHYKRSPNKKSIKKAVIWFGVTTIVLLGGFVWFASSNPDGLEWSLERVGGFPEIEESNTTTISILASKISNSTSIMPEYENPFSGIAGTLIVLLIIWCISSWLIKKPKKNVQNR